MLEVIRNRAQGWIARIILGLVVVTFAVFGIDSYFSGGSAGKPVATVGDGAISQQDFQQALVNHKDALTGMGVKVDTADPKFREEVLKQLVDTQILAEAARSMGLSVAPTAAQQIIAAAPAFQQDGKFSEQRLDNWLRTKGMSRAQLLAMVQQDVLINQLQQGLGDGVVLAGASVDAMVSALGQELEVQERIFDAARYLADAKVDEAAVKGEYETNGKRFETPAQVRVEYLLFKPGAIQGAMAPSETDLRRAYDESLAALASKEERRARHILILADAGMADANKKAARAKADKLLAEVKAQPAKFADLAKQHSQDPGSAANGGDLDWFSRDRMVKPFADAAFALKKGEISGVVESEFGFHIIKLDDIRKPQAPSFESQRAQLAETWLAREASRRFATEAEKFANLVYENPDSLAKAAEAYQLKVATSGWISRAASDPQLSNPRLLDAIFAPESLDKRQNTEAIEVGSNTLVAARVVEHKPAGRLPLDQVAPSIRKQLALRAAVDAARAAGKAALGAGENRDLSAPMRVSRMQPLNLPREAIKALFKADLARLPAWVGAETPEGYRVYRVASRAVTPQVAQQKLVIARDLREMQARAEMQAFLKAERESHPVTIDQKAVSAQ